jgi:hypothetical protein
MLSALLTLWRKCSYGNLIYRAGASNWGGHCWDKSPGVALRGTHDQYRHGSHLLNHLSRYNDMSPLAVFSERTSNWKGSYSWTLSITPPMLRILHLHVALTTRTDYWLLSITVDYYRYALLHVLTVIIDHYNQLSADVKHCSYCSFTPYLPSLALSFNCATNRKVTGSIPDGVTGIFHWPNCFRRTMTLRSTQPLTEMSTRNISWG